MWKSIKSLSIPRRSRPMFVRYSQWPKYSFSGTSFMLSFGNRIISNLIQVLVIYLYSQTNVAGRENLHELSNNCSFLNITKHGSFSVFGWPGYQLKYVNFDPSSNVHSYTPVLDLQILITPLVSCGHCVVCSSLIYRFWLTLWYLQTLL
jgi:hypothetical protein